MENENGQERAVLKVLENTLGLTLFDANGKSRAWLTAFKDGAM